MANTWVLVADSSRARIFAVDSPTSPLTEFRTLFILKAGNMNKI